MDVTLAWSALLVAVSVAIAATVERMTTPAPAPTVASAVSAGEPSA